MLGGIGAAVGSLAQLADAVGEPVDEHVVDRLLDVDALDRHADLARVDEAAVGARVDRAVHVGVGEDDRRVLAAELQRNGREGVRRPLHHDLAGPVRAGEVHEVDVVDQGAAGVARAVHEVEDVGPADLLLPAADHLHQLERSELAKA